MSKKSGAGRNGSSSSAESRCPYSMAHAYLNYTNRTRYYHLSTCAEIHEWAPHEGLKIDTVFTEYDLGSFEKFDAMLARVKQDRDRNRVRSVIVPSLDHFSMCEQLQAHMRRQVEDATGRLLRIIHERNRDRADFTFNSTPSNLAATPTNGPTRKLRYTCEWCQQPKRWPDRCIELPRGTGDNDPCTINITANCRRNDHRRCALNKCGHAARWHEPVRRAGIAASQAAGTRWSVVSTIRSDDVEVIGTHNEIKRARDAVAHTVVQAGVSGRGLIYIVRGSDGAFF